MNKVLQYTFGSACLVFIILVSNACQKSILPPIKPSEITKIERENLGDLMRFEIAAQTNTFDILPNAPPYDTTIYRFINALYQQVTTPMRINRSERSSDAWNKDRFWEVTILKDDVANAFVLPGGHFYITTGLLSQLEEEYELYYILAFEASLMNERYLLNRLIAEYNTLTLVELANELESQEGVTIEEIIDLIPRLEFQPELIQIIDEKVGDLICESSSMDRKGIIPVLGKSIDWLKYRPSYGNRLITIENLTESDKCGSFTTNGNYKKQVLDYL